MLDILATLNLAHDEDKVAKGHLSLDSNISPWPENNKHYVYRFREKKKILIDRQEATFMSVSMV